MQNTQTPRRTIHHRVLDVKKMLCAATAALSLSLFSSYAAQAQATNQEAEGTVEIRIYNKDVDDTKDDLVKYGSSVIAYLRLNGAGKDMAVVLTNPDGKLRFSRAGALGQTASMTLSKDGSWSNVTLVGYDKSSSASDTKVEVHKDSPSGDIKKSAVCTVYWFTMPKMETTKGNNYDFVGVYYQPSPKPAVNMLAEYKLQPTGLDCTAPQFANLGNLAICQNAKGGYAVYWDKPAVVFYDYAPATAKVTVAKQYKRINSIPTELGWVDDSYAAAGNGLYHGTTVPICGDGLLPETDPPAEPADESKIVGEVKDDNTGLAVGMLYYTHRLKVTMEASFVDWAVEYNPSTKTVNALRQTDWSLSLDSSSDTPQAAKVKGFDYAPNLVPGYWVLQC